MKRPKPKGVDIYIIDALCGVKLGKRLEKRQMLRLADAIAPGETMPLRLRRHILEGPAKRKRGRPRHPHGRHWQTTVMKFAQLVAADQVARRMTKPPTDGEEDDELAKGLSFEDALDATIEHLKRFKTETGTVGRINVNKDALRHYCRTYIYRR